MGVTPQTDLVSMPKKKISFKKAANGTIYVYYTVRAYRNKNGKPTSDEIALREKRRCFWDACSKQSLL
jgi:hypothetical protein